MLELGAGTALPSVVSTLLGAKFVVSSDRDEKLSMGVIRATFQMNGIQDGYKVVG